MPKISVIVPVYKAEQYLDRCVESILQQNFGDYEVILVDDGSPDRCPELCDGYAKQDARVRVVHKTNGGVSSARNAGLDAAKGEYVTFVDSDDYVEPDYLDALVGRDCDMAICCTVTHMEDDVQFSQYVLEDAVVCVSPESMSQWLENRVLFTVWGKSFRREIIENEQIRFRRDVRYGEDTIFVLTAINMCRKIRLDSRKAYHYIRYNNESLSKNVNRELVRSADVTDRFMGRWIKEHGVESSWYCSLDNPCKKKIQVAFRNVFEDREMSLREKRRWFRLFFSLETFCGNISVLFPNFSPRLRKILNSRSVWVLMLHELTARLKG